MKLQSTFCKTRILPDREEIGYKGVTIRDILWWNSEDLKCTIQLVAHCGIDTLQALIGEEEAEEIVN